MKDLLKIFFMISLVVVVYIFKDDISTYILDNVIYGGSNKVLTYNEYYLDYDIVFLSSHAFDIINGSKYSISLPIGIP